MEIFNRNQRDDRVKMNLKMIRQEKENVADQTDSQQKYGKSGLRYRNKGMTVYMIYSCQSKA